MHLFSRRSLLFSIIGASLLCALLLFGVGQSGQAHAATVSTTVAPRNVPLPDQSQQLYVVRVRSDGEFANQWKYTVNDTQPGTVVDFYHNNMTNYGWTLVHESARGPHGGQWLRYTQGNRICYIEAFLSHEIDGNTTLFITVTN
jgi:hypothetical protein